MQMSNALIFKKVNDSRFCRLLYCFKSSSLKTQIICNVNSTKRDFDAFVFDMSQFTNQSTKRSSRNKKLRDSLIESDLTKCICFSLFTISSLRDISNCRLECITHMHYRLFIRCSIIRCSITRCFIIRCSIIRCRFCTLCYSVITSVSQNVSTRFFVKFFRCVYRIISLMIIWYDSIMNYREQT